MLLRGFALFSLIICCSGRSLLDTYWDISADNQSLEDCNAGNLTPVWLSLESVVPPSPSATLRTAPPTPAWHRGRLAWASWAWRPSWPFINITTTRGGGARERSARLSVVSSSWNLMKYSLTDTAMTGNSNQWKGNSTLYWSSSRKMILIKDEEYQVQEETTFPTDKFSILLKLTKPVDENHLKSCI